MVHLDVIDPTNMVADCITAGGSTVIVLFPKGFMKFDDDLLKYSKEGIETVVKVGERIGVRV